MTEQPGSGRPPGGWASPGYDPPGPQPGQQPGQQPAPPGPPAGGPYPPPGGGNGWGAPPPPPMPGPGWGAGPPGPPPAPKPGVVPLRPLGFGEVLDGAFTTVQRYPKVLLGMSAAVMTALMLVSFLAMFLGLSDLMDAMAAPTDQQLLRLSDSAWISAGLSYLIVIVVAIVGTAALTGMITVTVGRGVLGQPATVGEVWRTAKGKIPRLIGLALLQGLVVGVGAGLATFAIVLLAVGLYQLVPALGILVGILLGLLALVGLVILWVRLAVAPAALVLETRPVDPGGHPGGEQRPLGVVESLRRSWRLVRGRTWRTFGLLFVANLIGGVVASIVQVAFMLLGGGLAVALEAMTDSGAVAGGASILLMGVGYVGSMVLQLAFLSAIYVLVYVDARIRGEGLDLELAHATSGDPTAGPSTAPASPWAAR